MKKIILAFLFLPVISFAQAHKKTSAKKPATEVLFKPADTYFIAGTVRGFAEGTAVSLINSSTGATEAQGVITKNKFVLTGKMTEPDFRFIEFNGQPPYITMFLDNSEVKIIASKDSLYNATITGSPSQTDFIAFNNMLVPYQYLFADDAPYDSAATSEATKLLSNFVRTHHGSYVSALAAIRYMQIADDNLTSEILYNTLTPNVQGSLYGKYLLQQLEDVKNNGVGTALPDFSQADTSGNTISLASYKGKYVLVDFWASWCHPCRLENPNVLAAYNKFKDKNFTILSVSLDENKDAWLYAIHQDNLSNWTHVSDLKGWNNAVAHQFGIVQIPQNILLDPKGIVIGKNLRGGALVRKLTRTLK